MEYNSFSWFFIYDFYVRNPVFLSKVEIPNRDMTFVAKKYLLFSNIILN